MPPDMRIVPGDDMAYTLRLDGSESTGPEGAYLVWSRDSTGLHADECACLEHALISYEAWASNDRVTLECIEGPAGVVPPEQVHAWVVAENARQAENTAAYLQSLAGQVRYTVELRAPDSNEATRFAVTDDLGEAVAICGRLNRPSRFRIVGQAYTDGPGWVNERVIHDWDTGIGQDAA